MERYRMFKSEKGGELIRRRYCHNATCPVAKRLAAGGVSVFMMSLNSMPPDVFISNSSKDKTVTDATCARSWCAVNVAGLPGATT
jgi:hypothetical protein